MTKPKLVRTTITTPGAEALVYSHGAHVAHYQPRDQRPVLFLSRKSWFEPGKPIRGGVPICFPWFGPKKDDPQAPIHGVARLREWQIAEQEPGRLTLSLTLPEFALRYCVTVGDALALSLEVRNTTATPVRFEEALHTYLAVGDVREVGIAGLTGAEYLDKADGGKRKTQGSEPIRITAETDRLYLNTRATCTVTDPVWKRRLIIEKAGSDATVVWNPWIAKAKAMPDFGDDEWPQMLCIETGNCADHAITLPPGEAHTLQAIIRVESR